MKPALSISDDLLRQIQELAEEKGVSQGEILQEAVQDYLTCHATRETLDCSEEEAKEDEECRAFVAAAARKIFERVEW